LTKKLICFD